MREKPPYHHKDQRMMWTTGIEGIHLHCCRVAYAHLHHYHQPLLLLATMKDWNDTFNHLCGSLDYRTLVVLA
jgi:hypothetical protein